MLANAERLFQIFLGVGLVVGGFCNDGMLYGPLSHGRRPRGRITIVGRIAFIVAGLAAAIDGVRQLLH